MRLPEKGDWEIVAWVILGAILFSAASVAIPSTFHYAQPADHYYSVQEVEVTVDEDDPCTHHWRTTYWARHETDITVHATLYELMEGNERRIVQEWEYESTVPEGVNNVHRERHVEEPLSAGVYQTEYTISFKTPYGWPKEVKQSSYQFGVHHGDENISEVFPEAGHVATYPSSSRCLDRN